MTRYLNGETIIAINAEHGGPGAGVLNRQGVFAAADRPSAGFGDHEEYVTIWEKAAILLHAIATTQSFTDGNKRTAWLATEAFLGLNGHELRDLPTITYESMILLVASDKTKFQYLKVAEWLEENSLKAADRINYGILGVPGGTSLNPANPSPRDTSYFLPVHGISVNKMPIKGAVVALVGVHWYSVDAGSTKTLRAEFRDNANGALLIDSVDTQRTVRGEVVRHWEAPWFPNGIQPWNEYLVLPLLAKDDGQTFIDVFIDDELAWSDTLTWQYRESAPDTIPANFLLS